MTRYRLKNKKRFTIFLLLVFILLSSSFTFTVNAKNRIEYKEITIKGGDTLWGIAQKYGKDSDIRRYIYEIKRINNMKESIIYAGQDILIPQ